MIYVEGPLYDVRVVTCDSNTIRKHYGKKDRSVFHGMFDPKKNIIYLASDQSKEEQLQAFMHELVHVLEYQTQSMDEESRMDCIGSYLVRLFRLKAIGDILK